MRKCSVCGRVLHCVLALASAAFFIHSASGDESPYATGGEVTILQRGNALTAYIHVFTNTDEAATFASTGLKDLNVRYLVVGAGGSGGACYSSGSEGGGGGGGGGVCEKSQIPFVRGSSWRIVVGKGSGDDAAAGASSISNDTVDVETVPGGGNGATGQKTAATRGAAGGGGKRTEPANTGADGTYVSSILGVSPENAPFKGGNNSSSRAGGGGGGAGSAGLVSPGSAVVGNPTVSGGEGLVSDITGEELVYGSGGGGGVGKNTSPSFYQGGLGGTRAGDGGYIDRSIDWTNETYAATDAAPNSGGGGGGAAGYGADTRRGRGADGIVVIRYDIYDSPCEGGDIVTKKVEGPVTTWVHQFTTAAPRFRSERELLNLAGHDLSVRYLVVGAGGAGGKYVPPGQVNGGGGGGGGGGVCEKGGVPFAVGDSWQIVVGAGGVASVSNTMAKSCGGTSAISNGVADVETVPGGGGGSSAKPTKTADCGYAAQNGASGGGASLGYKTQGGNGTYTNSLFGVEYGPFNGGKNNSSGYPGSGGGGASESGQNKSSSNSPIGGEGLVSDITGEPLVYGSGGGGGFGVRTTTSGSSKAGTLAAGGVGGTRGGIGAMYEIETIDDGTKVTNYIAAVAPAANSGGGGGGGSRSYSPTVVVYAPTPGADGIVVISYKTYYDGACPCAGGDVVTRTLVKGTCYTYRHFFTDARMADLFVNNTGRKLNLRYLVVGGGGSGGNSSTASGGGDNSSSGGGGGGGGVCETNGVPFGADGEWTVRVGVGAKKVASFDDPGTAAGASSISNGTDEIVLVPGGGNGAKASTATAKVVPATAGAAGGGGTTYTTDGGTGTYASSIFGEVPVGAPFAGGEGGSYTGGGGGGAAAAGTQYTASQAGDGGEGLSSDITGEELVYGSGGGGGANAYRNRVGGQGGRRAGNGATYEKVDGTTVYYPATEPAANSGCGGAGGMQDGNCNVATDGADGIVIISYDYDATPPGFLMLFK